jgi:DnaK suppressor protein
MEEVKEIKVRYSDQELSEFKAILLEKLEEAKKSFAEQNEWCSEIELPPVAFKILKEGSAYEAKEITGQLAGRQSKFREKIEAALYRIDKKTYGICFVSGKLIPKERLLACPIATTCIENK